MKIEKLSYFKQRVFGPTKHKLTGATIFCLENKHDRISLSQDLLLAACGEIGPQNEYSDRGKPSKDILFQNRKETFNSR